MLLQITCFITFAALSIRAASTDFIISSDPYATTPFAYINSTDVAYLSLLRSSTTLLNGPENGTFVLLSSYQEANAETWNFFRRIYNATTYNATINDTNLNFNLKLTSVQTVASTSWGYIAFSSANLDPGNIYQVFGYVMQANASKIVSMVLTTNIDPSVAYAMGQLWDQSAYFAVAYTQGTYTSNNIATYAPASLVLQTFSLDGTTLGPTVTLVTASVVSPRCARVLDATTAYCIYKNTADSKVYSIGFDTAGTTIGTPAVLAADATYNGVTTTYTPLMVVSASGYNVFLISQVFGTNNSIMATTSDSSISNVTIMTWDTAGSQTINGITLNSAIPYYDGYALLYTISKTDGSKAFTMAAFFQNGTINGTEYTLVTVGSAMAMSSFQVLCYDANTQAVAIMLKEGTSTAVKNIYLATLFNRTTTRLTAAGEILKGFIGITCLLFSVIFLS